MKNIPVAAGRLAFFVDPASKRIRYGLIASHNRYADNETIYEFPRGAPDKVFVNDTLPQGDPKRTLVVEWGKEQKALGKIGITLKPGESPEETLEKTGYFLALNESLSATAAREGREEHGFSGVEHAEKVARIISFKNLLPFKSFYGDNPEFQQYVELVHITDPHGIDLAESPEKIEKNIPGRVGAHYSEKGQWVTYEEVAAQVDRFPPGRTRDYVQSIADNLRDIELVTVHSLQNGPIHTNGWVASSRNSSPSVTTGIPGHRSITTMMAAHTKLLPEIVHEYPDVIKKLGQDRTIIV